MWSGTRSPTACQLDRLAQLLLLAAPLSHVAHQGQHGGAAAELRCGWRAAPSQQAGPSSQRYWSSWLPLRLGPVADALLVALHHQRRELGRDRSPAMGSSTRSSGAYAPEQRRQRQLPERRGGPARRTTCVGHGGQQRAHRRLALLQRRFATLALGDARGCRTCRSRPSGPSSTLVAREGAQASAVSSSSS